MSSSMQYSSWSQSKSANTPVFPAVENHVYDYILHLRAAHLPAGTCIQRQTVASYHPSVCAMLAHMLCMINFISATSEVARSVASTGTALLKSRSNVSSVGVEDPSRTDCGNAHAGPTVGKDQMSVTQPAHAGMDAMSGRRLQKSPTLENRPHQHFKLHLRVMSLDPTVLVTVYTDGSVLHSNRQEATVSGWGWLAWQNGRQFVQARGSLPTRYTTPSVYDTEACAVLEALRNLGKAQQLRMAEDDKYKSGTPIARNGRRFIT
eukprot:1296703-Amphidinium_carterae.1